MTLVDYQIRKEQPIDIILRRASKSLDYSLFLQVDLDFAKYALDVLLIPIVKESKKRCLYLFGEGNTGKTTFINMLARIFSTCKLNIRTRGFVEPEGNIESALVVSMNEFDPYSIT